MVTPWFPAVESYSQIWPSTSVLRHNDDGGLLAHRLINDGSCTGPQGGDVGGDAWPENSSLSTCHHWRYSLVCSMESSEDFLTERGGDDYTLLVDDNSINSVQIIAELVVVSEWGREFMTMTGHARFDNGHKLVHVRITGCDQPHSIPGHCLKTVQSCCMRFLDVVLQAVDYFLTWPHIFLID